MILPRSLVLAAYARALALDPDREAAIAATAAALAIAPEVVREAVGQEVAC